MRWNLKYAVRSYIGGSMWHDVARLVKQARKASGIIEFVPRAGDFLAVDEPLYRLYGGASDAGGPA